MSHNKNYYYIQSPQQVPTNIQYHQNIQYSQQFPPQYPQSLPPQYYSSSHPPPSHVGYVLDHQHQTLDNKPYILNTVSTIQTQPIIIEKVQKQQFLIEKPVITREIIHQPFVQTSYTTQEFTMPRLKKSRSLSQSNLYDGQIIESHVVELPVQLEKNSQIFSESQHNEEKISSLEKQIVIYRTELEKKHQENDEYMKKIQKLEFLRQDYENRLRTQNNDLDSNVLVLTQEIDRYKRVIQEYENRSIAQNNDMEGCIISLKQEIERYKLLLNRKDQEITALTNEIKDKGELKSDINKISGFLAAKVKEIEDCKLRLSEKDGIFSEIEKKMKILMDEIDRLNSSLRQKTEEVTFLNSQIFEFHSLTSEYEQKSSVLSREIDRLNCIINENNRELDTWRYKYTEYSSLTVKVQDLLVTILLLACEIEGLRMRVKGSEQEVEEMRRSNIMKSIG